MTFNIQDEVKLNTILDSANNSGDAGQVLSSTGSNTLLWIDQGDVTIPGSNTEILFNNSGVIGANNQFVFDKETSRLGIGTNTPTQSIDVVGTNTNGVIAKFSNQGNNANALGIRIDAGTNTGGAATRYIDFYDSDGSDLLGWVDYDGAGTFSFDVPCDETFKADIEDTTIDGVGIINLLRIRDFTLIRSGKKSTGFIAQELEQVLPRAVKEDKDTGLKYISSGGGHFEPIILKAIQQLTQRIETLEKTK